MRIAVVAATGGVGKHVVEQAVTAGHQVTALVRNPSSFDRDIPVFALDLSRPPAGAEVLDTLAAADAVISCLGPRGRTESGIVAPATRRLAEAMLAAGSRRLVIISGAGVSTVPTPTIPHPPRREPGAGWWNQYVAAVLAAKILGDHFVDVAHAEHELRVAAGEGCLDWTAFRAPYLTNGPLTGRYRTAVGHSVPRGFRLSRADAAHAMLRTVDDPETIGAAIAAAY